MNDIPWSDVIKLLLASGGVIGVIFTVWKERSIATINAKAKADSEKLTNELAIKKAELERDIAEHKLDAEQHRLEVEKFATQVAAQESARGTIEVTRLTQETTAQGQQSTMQLTEEEHAVDYIRELEGKLHARQQDLDRVIERLAHAETVAIELASGYADLAEETGHRQPRLVATVLMGTGILAPVSVAIAPDSTVQVQTPTTLVTVPGPASVSVTRPSSLSAEHEPEPAPAARPSGPAPTH